MGIPEGRGKMGGSHMGKENNGIAVPIKIFQFNFQIFSYLGLTKTNLVSNSLTERVRQI